MLGAGAARYGTCVKYYCRPSALTQAGERVLEPGPVSFAGGHAALCTEAVERVVVKLRPG